MVSNAPNSQSYDYKNILKEKNNKFLPQVCESINSISGILRTTSKFSKFFYILHLSGMLRIYNDSNYGGITLFVPIDDRIGISEKEMINMTAIEAIDIIKRHTVENIITYELLLNSRSFFLDTKHPSKRLLIGSDGTNIVTLNYETVIIYGNINAENGIIHVIDSMIDS